MVGTSGNPPAEDGIGDLSGESFRLRFQTVARHIGFLRDGKLDRGHARIGFHAGGMRQLGLFGVKFLQKRRLFPIDFVARPAQRVLIFRDFRIRVFQAVLGRFARPFGQAEALRENFIQRLEIEKL